MERTNESQQCINDCLACYQECSSCIPHCISEGEKHTELSHITLMMECAEMCRTSADLMLKNGQFAFEQCQLCAKACDACAESCSSIDPEDLMMQKCAEMCRKCADSCRNLASGSSEKDKSPQAVVNNDFVDNKMKSMDDSQGKSDFSGSAYNGPGNVDHEKRNSNMNQRNF